MVQIFAQYDFGEEGGFGGGVGGGIGKNQVILSFSFLFLSFPFLISLSGIFS